MKHYENKYVELAKKYEKFFKHLQFGVECGPGWYNIIEKLTEDINGVIDREKLQDVWATQVKEKYGTLRYYVSSATDEIYDLLEKATYESRTICEVCGEPGQLKKDGWLWVTRCEKCEKEGF